MLKDIVAVNSLENYHLHLRFEDGIEGIVDISQLIEFHGIFAKLQDPTYFATVTVNPEIGTLVWDCGADLDPDVLYAIAAQQPIPTYEAIATTH
jgi:Protein of unknown function (DUF2442)